MDPAAVGILIPFAALSIPAIAIVAKHRQKMEEIRLRAGKSGDPGVVKALDDLKQQMTELRDTTTRYDLSFDAALQRIESRVGSLEGRVRTVEQSTGTNAAASSSHS